MGEGNVGPAETRREDERAGARREQIGYRVDPLRPKIDVEQRAIDLLPSDKGDGRGDVGDAAGDVKAKFRFDGGSPA